MGSIIELPEGQVHSIEYNILCNKHRKVMAHREILLLAENLLYLQSLENTLAMESAMESV